MSLIVGSSGIGEIQLSGGSIYADVASIGSNANSTGAVTVSNASSLLRIEDFLNVGDKGSGTLNVEAGGQVFTSVGTIATGSGGDGRGNGDGCRFAWSFGNGLNVGYRGIEELEILDGGLISSGYGTADIGTLAGADGTVTVSGIGSALAAQNLNVGWPGVHEFSHFGDGGVVSLRPAQDVGELQADREVVVMFYRQARSNFSARSKSFFWIARLARRSCPR